jgi:anti-sigma regulatory factor (Ser/Thr protein kinase)
MPYYTCPECALSVWSDAGRFTASSCPRCSVPLERSDQSNGVQPHAAAISHRFRAEPEAACAARRALETLREELDPTQFHSAALLTTELVANAVEHAANGSPGEVRLDAIVTGDHIHVAVGDDGGGFIPAARTAGAPLDSHWGLHLVDQLADRWGVVTDPRTLVWFELKTAVSSRTAGRGAATQAVPAQV